MDYKRLFDLLSNWTANQLGNIFINVFIGLLHSIRAFHTIQLKDGDFLTQWPSVPSTIYVLSLITFACGYRPRFKQPNCCVLAGALFAITVIFYVLIYEYIVLNSWLYIMEFIYYKCHLMPIEFIAAQCAIRVKSKSLCEFAEFVRNDAYYWLWWMAALTAFCFMIDMTDVVAKLGKALCCDAEKEKSILDKNAKEGNKDSDEETKDFYETKDFDEETMRTVLRAYSLATHAVADGKRPGTDSKTNVDGSANINQPMLMESNADGPADNLSKLPDQVVHTSGSEVRGTNNANNLNGNMPVCADNGQWNTYPFRDFYSSCRCRRGPCNANINSRRCPH